MRVGFVVYGGLEEISGGYRYDRKLVERLRAAGDAVEVIALPWPNDEDRLAADPPTDRCDPADGDRPADSPAIRERIDRPVDVLVQDELCYPSLLGHNPHLEEPGAIVGLVHLLQTGPHRDDPRPSAVRAEQRYLESVDGLVCTSDDTRRRAGELTDVPTPAVVAPPAGRHEGPRIGAAEVAARAREGPLRLVALGSVVPRKGVGTLVRALGALEASGDAPAVELDVLGTLTADPSYADRVRESAAALGIDDRVTFAGAVSDETVRTALERVHALAVPSRYESFGIAYLEAMECGAVPIATEVGGPPEFVTHGEDGVLVAPGDREALARAIADLAADRDRLAAMGEAALETAAAHPSWEESMARVREFLRAVAPGEGDVSPSSFEPIGGTTEAGDDSSRWSRR